MSVPKIRPLQAPAVEEALSSEPFKMITPRAMIVAATGLKSAIEKIQPTILLKAEFPVSNATEAAKTGKNTKAIASKTTRMRSRQASNAEARSAMMPKIKMPAAAARISAPIFGTKAGPPAGPTLMMGTNAAARFFMSWSEASFKMPAEMSSPALIRRVTAMTAAACAIATLISSCTTTLNSLICKLHTALPAAHMMLAT
ncbi:hypothetical protein ACUIAJ_09100, partial [Dermabacteraceae bacterium CCM 9519]